MAIKQTTIRRRVLASLPLLAVLGFILLWTQRQYFFDQYRLYNYQPSSVVAQLATDGTMTDHARRIYYVNHPEVKSRDNFNSYCSDHGEQTVVLGCYLSGQRGIYLLTVNNPELKGIEQVTAAHEMLHAAYERLDAQKQQTVDAQLRTFYEAHRNEESIKQAVESYKNIEPAELVNEMHSIFGTQVMDLPAELEDYYAQYFQGRRKLVAYYQSYEQAFTSRQKQIEAYDLQLNSQKQQIESLEKQVSDQYDELGNKRRALDALRTSSNVDNYNNSVDDYNSAVRSYNGAVGSLKALIESYNQLIEKRNDIAFEERELAESLSAPAP